MKLDRDTKIQLQEIYDHIGALLCSDTTIQAYPYRPRVLTTCSLYVNEMPSHVAREYDENEIISYNGDGITVGDTDNFGGFIPWIEFEDDFICERNIITGISWETLAANGLTDGSKIVKINRRSYALRLLDDNYVKRTGLLAYPDVWHSNGIRSWGMATNENNTGYKYVYGNGRRQEVREDYHDYTVGYRPVLKRM